MVVVNEFLDYEFESKQYRIVKYNATNLSATIHNVCRMLLWLMKIISTVEVVNL